MITHDTLTCQPACRGGAGRRLFLQSIYLQSIYLSSYLIIAHWTVQALKNTLTAGCYLVTLIPEVISNIGSKIAITMNPTTTPMNRITTGSMMEVSATMVASTSSS
jgi:hypothetical protein